MSVGLSKELTQIPWEGYAFSFTGSYIGNKGVNPRADSAIGLAALARLGMQVGTKHRQILSEGIRQATVTSPFSIDLGTKHRDKSDWRAWVRLDSPLSMYSWQQAKVTPLVLT